MLMGVTKAYHFVLLIPNHLNGFFGLKICWQELQIAIKNIPSDSLGLHTKNVIFS